MTACFDADEDQVEALMMTDDDQEGLACLGVETGEEPNTHHVDQFFAGHHDYAAMASLVGWSPADEVDCAPSWMLVAVRRGEPPAFLVGRIPERQWYRVDPFDAPWFAVSTAGSMRAVLDGQPPGPIKKARHGDPRLFGRPGQGDEAPPVDEHGRI